jgi:putative ABC transport system ATP-binding protein
MRGTALRPHDGVLEVDAVTRIYGSGARAVRAVDGVSFTLRPGEVVAIVGPSGSGKTTLLQLVGGIDRPTAGRVLHSGVDIATLSPGELTALRRRQIGFVFQFFNLVPALSAEENVALALRLDGVGRREARAVAAELLGRVGLADRRDHLPSELSGGEQQRVGIARALAGSPPLVAADEPTGALDARTGATVMDLLVTAARERDAAVLLVTHDERVVPYADRVLQMADGRLQRELAPDAEVAELRAVM